MAKTLYTYIDTSEAGRSQVTTDVQLVEGFVLAVHDDVTDNIEFTAGVVYRNSNTSARTITNVKWRAKQGNTLLTRSGGAQIASFNLPAGDKFTAILIPVGSTTEDDLLHRAISGITSYTNTTLGSSFDIVSSDGVWRSGVTTAYRKTVTRTTFNGYGLINLEEYY